VRTYFQEYDRELLELAEPVIQQIARKTEEYYQEGAVVDESEYQELLETHSDLVRSFKRKESQLIEASSLKAYQLQSRMLEVMRQSFEVSYNYTR